MAPKRRPPYRIWPCRGRFRPSFGPRLSLRLSANAWAAARGAGRGLGTPETPALPAPRRRPKSGRRQAPGNTDGDGDGRQPMAKQDYYETLGVARGRRGRTRSRRPIASSRCSTTPTANPATRAPRRGFKEINEAYDVLKDQQKRAAYDRCRPCRLRRLGRAAGGPAAGRPGSISAPASRTSSTRCSASSWAAPGAAGRTAAAAPTCATTWRSRWRTPSAASRRRSGSRPRWSARTATAAARRAGLNRSPALPATAWARCAPSRASSPSSGPARAAAAPAG